MNSIRRPYSYSYQYPHSSRPHQTGVSLIELLVGVTIGVLVVLAATSTVILNRSASNTMSDTGAVTRQASDAIRQMSFALRQAGAFDLQSNDSTLPLSQQAFYLGNPASTTTPPVVTGVEGANNSADSLTVNFGNRAADITRDCLGAQAPAVGANVPNTFSLRADNTLMCTGLALFPQPLTQNVEDFQVQYLIDQGSGARQWVNATTVTAAAAWNRLVAVNICMVVRGNVNHGTVLTGDYTNCADVVTPQNNFYRVVMRQTVQLRNRMYIQ